MHGTLDRVHRRVLPQLWRIISPRLSIASVSSNKAIQKSKIPAFKASSSHISENCCGQVKSIARQYIKLTKVEGHRQPATEPFTIKNNKNELENILLGLIL